MGFKTTGHSNRRCHDSVDKGKYEIWSSKESLRLDLVLTKESDIIRKLEYQYPLSRTDNILIVMEIGEIDKVKLN